MIQAQQGTTSNPMLPSTWEVPLCLCFSLFLGLACLGAGGTTTRRPAQQRLATTLVVASVGSLASRLGRRAADHCKLSLAWVVLFRAALWLIRKVSQPA